jgi:protein tyrosine phosphatase (PTP) superfamily phosphohydrolase (DUF442 family)
MDRSEREPSAPTTSQSPQSAPAASSGGAKSAAGRLLARVMSGVHAVEDELMNLGGEAIGVAELAGLRYSVKPYEAQVSPTLYRGSRLDDAGMAALKQQGIKGVVNLCLENNDDAARAAKLGLHALHVPILDNSAPTEAQMEAFLAFVRDPSNQPAYVHCEAGKGRTGTACACYRIAVDHWTADQAIAEGRSLGLEMPNQIAFIKQFAEDVAAGKAG